MKTQITKINYEKIKSKIDTEILLRVLYYALKCYKDGLIEFKPADVIKNYQKMNNEEEMTEVKCSLYLEFLWYNGFFSKHEKENKSKKTIDFIGFNFENASINYLK